MKKKDKHKCSCGETNPDKFYGHKKQICAACHNKYNKIKARQNKEFIVEYLGNKCSNCGYNKCIAALDIHHLDPSTKDPKFATLKFRSRKRIIKEIENCILLCANCHREEHWNENI